MGVEKIRVASSPFAFGAIVTGDGDIGGTGEWRIERWNWRREIKDFKPTAILYMQDLQ